MEQGNLKLRKSVQCIAIHSKSNSYRCGKRYEFTDWPKCVCVLYFDLDCNHQHMNVTMLDLWPQKRFVVTGKDLLDSAWLEFQDLLFNFETKSGMTITLTASIPTEVGKGIYNAALKTQLYFYENYVFFQDWNRRD